MKLKLTFILVFMLASLMMFISLIPRHSVAAAEGVTAGCIACHQGKRSLAGRDVECLAAAIRSIRDGDLKHPPLGLQDDSDAAIDALAEALSKP